METGVVRSTLVASVNDFGYITYVFQLLDEEEIKLHDTKYIMCVRYPNWEHPSINLNDVGYLKVIEIEAGIDKYYKNSEFIPYNYNSVQFIKFVPEVNTENKEMIL